MEAGSGHWLPHKIQITLNESGGDVLVENCSQAEVVVISQVFYLLKPDALGRSFACGGVQLGLQGVLRSKSSKRRPSRCSRPSRFLLPRKKIGKKQDVPMAGFQ